MIRVSTSRESTKERPDRFSGERGETGNGRAAAEQPADPLQSTSVTRGHPLPGQQLAHPPRTLPPGRASFYLTITIVYELLLLFIYYC